MSDRSMNKRLAPFIHTEKNAPYIYLTLLAGMVPCAFYAVFYYGIRAIVLMAFCSIMFTLSDRLFTRLAGRAGKGEYFDLSSPVSGLLIALMLPPDTSIATAFCAVVFASVIIKQVFGGAGCNLLNPAAAGRLFVEMTMPSRVYGFAQGGGQRWFDMSTLLLGSERTKAFDYSHFSVPELLAGNYPGSLGACCIVCVLLGAVFLIMRGSIRLYAPAAYIATLALLYPFSQMIDGGFGAFGFEGFVTFILSYEVIFVAVFMLGDLTTMPLRFTSGVFAGVVCAGLTLVMKEFVSHETALLAPVLAVNFMSFVMDFLSKTISRRKMRPREVDVL